MMMERIKTFLLVRMSTFLVMIMVLLGENVNKQAAASSCFSPSSSSSSSSYYYYYYYYYYYSTSAVKLLLMSLTGQGPL